MVLSILLPLRFRDRTLYKTISRNYRRVYTVSSSSPARRLDNVNKIYRQKATSGVSVRNAVCLRWLSSSSCPVEDRQKEKDDYRDNSSSTITTPSKITFTSSSPSINTVSPSGGNDIVSDSQKVILDKNKVTSPFPSTSTLPRTSATSFPTKTRYKTSATNPSATKSIKKIATTDMETLFSEDEFGLFDDLKKFSSTNKASLSNNVLSGLTNEIVFHKPSKSRSHPKVTSDLNSSPSLVESDESSTSSSPSSSPSSSTPLPPQPIPSSSLPSSSSSSSLSSTSPSLSTSSFPSSSSPSSLSSSSSRIIEPIEVTVVSSNETNETDKFSSLKYNSNTTALKSVPTTSTFSSKTIPETMVSTPTIEESSKLTQVTQQLIASPTVTSDPPSFSSRNKHYNTSPPATSPIETNESSSSSNNNIITSTPSSVPTSTSPSPSKATTEARSTISITDSSSLSKPQPNSSFVRSSFPMPFRNSPPKIGKKFDFEKVEKVMLLMKERQNEQKNKISSQPPLSSPKQTTPNEEQNAIRNQKKNQNNVLSGLPNSIVFNNKGSFSNRSTMSILEEKRKKERMMLAKEIKEIEGKMKERDMGDTTVKTTTTATPLPFERTQEKNNNFKMESNISASSQAHFSAVKTIPNKASAKVKHQNSSSLSLQSSLSLSSSSQTRSPTTTEIKNSKSSSKVVPFPSAQQCPSDMSLSDEIKATISMPSHTPPIKTENERNFNHIFLFNGKTEKLKDYINQHTNQTGGDCATNTNNKIVKTGVELTKEEEVSANEPETLTTTPSNLVDESIQNTHEHLNSVLTQGQKEKSPARSRMELSPKDNASHTSLKEKPMSTATKVGGKSDNPIEAPLSSSPSSSLSSLINPMTKITTTTTKLSSSSTTVTTSKNTIIAKKGNFAHLDSYLVKNDFVTASKLCRKLSFPSSSTNWPAGKLVWFFALGLNCDIAAVRGRFGKLYVKSSEQKELPHLVDFLSYLLFRFDFVIIIVI
eukprot:Awhi_evm1s14161